MDSAFAYFLQLLVAVLITGGHNTGVGGSVELYVPGSGAACRLPQLPDNREFHSLDSDLLCGGMGTEESCLALATGLWQDETVSKKKLLIIFYERCGTTSLATTRRSGSARTVRSCSRRWDLLEHLVDKRRWTCINLFGRDLVVSSSERMCIMAISHSHTNVGS